MDRAPAYPVRGIRSFIRREGRITDAQQSALDRLWSRYGVDGPEAGRLDLASLFDRSDAADPPRLIVEIGFGNGEHLAARARSSPQDHFLGIEVHRPGLGHLLRRAEALELNNLRVASMDAVELLRDWLPAESVDEILILFPDPWPKKRHNKRRLIQPAFVGLLGSVLHVGGRLRLATDWAPYAEQMLEVLSAEVSLRNNAAAGGFIERPSDRPLTRFESRGLRLGHAVFDLEFVRTGPAS